MITFVPVGGLANRLRSIVSALSLAEDCNTHLRIIWFRDKGLNCDFHSLFQPLNYPNVTLRDATVLDYWIYDRPRKKNLRLPSLFQYFLFQKRMYERETRRIVDTFDFFGWANNSKVLLASYDIFYPMKYSLTDCFIPLENIRSRIQKYVDLFDEHTVGVHIRRTDHRVSISQSTTDSFIDQMNKELSNNPQTRFFLATDSEEERELLKNIFKERIITASHNVTRETQSGLEDAVIDLYLLSKTNKIFGSAESTFSQIAAEMSGIECITITKNG